MVPGIAEQEAGPGAMDDNPNVSVHSDRPEIRVFRSVQFVELQAWMGRIELKIESRGLDGFLFLARQSGKAVGERICNSEFHGMS